MRLAVLKFEQQKLDFVGCRVKVKEKDPKWWNFYAFLRFAGWFYTEFYEVNGHFNSIKANANSK
jgi:hypothetical protein